MSGTLLTINVGISPGTTTRELWTRERLLQALWSWVIHRFDCASVRMTHDVDGIPVAVVRVRVAGPCPDIRSLADVLEQDCVAYQFGDVFGLVGCNTEPYGIYERTKFIP